MSKIFTPQETHILSIYNTELGRQQDEFAAMSATLQRVGHQYSSWKGDSDDVIRLNKAYQTLKRNQNLPEPKYSLDNESCNVRLRKVKIKCLSALHEGGSAHNQPWKQVERSCLICCVKQNNKGFFGPKTTLQQLFRDISEYFDRTPDAIAQEWNKIINK